MREVAASVVNGKSTVTVRISGFNRLLLALLFLCDVVLLVAVATFWAWLVL